VRHGAEPTPAKPDLWGNSLRVRSWTTSTASWCRQSPGHPGWFRWPLWHRPNSPAGHCGLRRIGADSGHNTERTASGAAHSSGSTTTYEVDIREDADYYMWPQSSPDQSERKWHAQARVDLGVRDTAVGAEVLRPGALSARTFRDRATGIEPAFGAAPTFVSVPLTPGNISCL